MYLVQVTGQSRTVNAISVVPYVHGVMHDCDEWDCDRSGMMCLKNAGTKRKMYKRTELRGVTKSTSMPVRQVLLAVKHECECTWYHRSRIGGCTRYLVGAVVMSITVHAEVSCSA